MIEDFPHSPPRGYSYEFKPFKQNVTGIWIRNHACFAYTSDPVISIWGFYNSKKRCYYSPINAKKCGKVVDIKDTSPFSAMIIDRGPLAAMLC